MPTQPLKVLTVFGTRPEAVKLGPVIRELARFTERIESRVCVTAQHRDMLDQVLAGFGVQPDFDLDVMQNNQTPTQVAAAVLAGLEPILREEQPDWVLVQGDTTTVASAALAAFYARAHVGHVEAGLRTGDRWQPFPEEINRRVARVIADRHFAPTSRSRDNLLRENVPPEAVLVTGNPGIDALQWITAQPASQTVRDLLMAAPEARTILVTAHRRENFGQPLAHICQALREIAAKYADSVRIIYPVHRNPNVWGPVHELLDNVPNITLRPPLDYLSMLHLMKRSISWSPTRVAFRRRPQVWECQRWCCAKLRNVRKASIPVRCDWLERTVRALSRMSWACSSIQASTRAWRKLKIPLATATRPSASSLHS